jgi:MoaA/NifB/PqqE/SkfB family radical SAM enzyme
MSIWRRFVERVPPIGKYFGKRVFNLVRNVAEEKLGRAAPAAFPLFVDVVLTTRCNINCVMCIKLDAAAPSMDAGTFRHVARELFPRALEVFFCSGGESFLHPDFDEFLGICREYRIRTRILTNGMALDRAVGEMLLRRRVWHLGISFDAATPATLASIRKGADFERILQNVRDFERLKAAAGTTRPRLYSMYTLMKSNLAELPAFVALARSVGVRHVQVNYLALANDVAEDELVFHNAAEARAAFAAAREVASDLGVELALPPPIEDNAGPSACRWPWRFTWVYPDGSVLPCYLLRATDSFGTLAAGAAFRPIWNSPAYVAMRRDLAAGRPAFPQCEYCGGRCGFSTRENHLGAAKLAEFVAAGPP